MDKPKIISSLLVSPFGSVSIRELIIFTKFRINTNIVKINIKKYIESILCIFFCLTMFKNFSSQSL